MTPIKRHCQFLVDKERDKEDGRVRYRIKWEGNTVAFNVGYRVFPDKWSKETQRCKLNTTHGEDKISASEINKSLQEMEELINSIFYTYEKEELIPTKEEIRFDYNTAIGKVSLSKDLKVQELFKEFIAMESQRNSWSKITVNRLENVQRHLEEFNKNLEVNKITDNTLQQFLNVLINKKKLRNTTAHKLTSHAKWFLRWAYKHNYYKGNAHLTFTPKFKGLNNREVIHLTWEELIALYNKNFDAIPYLDQVRDVFCFCCFTGLRYSDVKKLTKEDVYKDRIEIVTQKTIDRLQIDLNDFSRAIINKYKRKNFPNHMALPVISNQRMNDYLKDIGKRMKFDTPIRQVYFKGNKRYEEVKPKYELLTTHCGRRTFVVNALTLGIPSEVIMRWTGHSDYESMKPYMKIVDKLKKSEMSKFNMTELI